MYEFKSYNTHAYSGQKYILRENGRTLCLSEVVDKWTHDDHFTDFFSRILEDVPFQAFFWETPPFNTLTINNDFEFVVIESLPLSRFREDRDAFAEHFNEELAVGFPNLGGDAQLIVTCPVNPETTYTHLGIFLRTASKEQKRALWKLAALRMKQKLSDKDHWISTCGLGIGWTHIRIDTRPKYYSYLPYTKRF